MSAPVTRCPSFITEDILDNTVGALLLGSYIAAMYVIYRCVVEAWKKHVNSV